MCNYGGLWSTEKKVKSKEYSRPAILTDRIQYAVDYKHGGTLSDMKLLSYSVFVVFLNRLKCGPILFWRNLS